MEEDITIYVSVTLGGDRFDLKLDKILRSFPDARKALDLFEQKVQEALKAEQEKKKDNKPIPW